MLLFASTLFMIEPAAADAPPPPPIVNGERTSDFIQVGAIMAYSDNYGGYSFCSATLIHEKWAVTAAHCLEAASEYYTYGQDIYFVMGENHTDGESSTMTKRSTGFCIPIMGATMATSVQTLV